MNVYIYLLRHPETREVRYVGKAANLKQRLSTHISEAKSNKSKRYVVVWIRSLLIKGLLPEMVIIEICNEDEWEEREKRWISYYRENGELCNHSDGGLGTSGNFCRPYQSEDERKLVYDRVKNNLPFKYTEEDRKRIYEIIKISSSFKECKLLIPEIKETTYNDAKNGKIWRTITGGQKLGDRHIKLKKYYAIVSDGVKDDIIKAVSKGNSHISMARKYNLNRTTIVRIVNGNFKIPDRYL